MLRPRREFRQLGTRPSLRRPLLPSICWQRTARLGAEQRIDSGVVNRDLPVALGSTRSCFLRKSGGDELQVQTGDQNDRREDPTKFEFHGTPRWRPQTRASTDLPQCQALPMKFTFTSQARSLKTERLRSCEGLW
jgi:hypothetical protein